MSLDSSLRVALLRGGDAIVVDADRGMAEVTRRVRSAKRRRAACGTLIACLAATAFVLWPGTDALDQRRVPPARNETIPEPRPQMRQELMPVRRGEVARPTGVRATPVEHSRPRQEGRARAIGSRASAKRAAVVAPDPWSSVVKERYEVKYVAGAHLSESAGTGCWKDEAATGSNDCIPLEVGAKASRLVLSLVDDAGVPVGARVYEHRGDEAVDHGTFCGRSPELSVHPRALLLIYIETSDLCSPRRPTRGTVVARFS